MFKRMLVLMLACLSLTGAVQAGLWDNITGFFGSNNLPQQPTIKVLIAHDVPGVVLEVKGKYKLFDPRNGDHISTRYVGKSKNIQVVHDGLKWGEEFPGVYQLLIVPDDPSTVTLVDGKEYHGTLAVYDIGGTISVVNNTFVEEFLSSSLNATYKTSMPEELLAAIAIAARTTAYYQTANPKSQYFAVDGRQYGYQGQVPVDPSKGIERALRSTRYMIIGRNSAELQKSEPFVAEWKASDPSRASVSAGTSLMSLADAEAMASRGDHAAQILAKAFPGSAIEYLRFASN